VNASRTDRWVGIVTLGFCAAVLALTFRFDEVPVSLMQGLGAELFPRLVIVTMAVLAVMIVLGVGVSALAPPPPIPPMVWQTGAVTVAFMAAVELAGMWIACLAFLIGLGRLWGERSLLRLAASALALTGALYLLFVRVLGVTFQPGLLAGLWS